MTNILQKKLLSTYEICTKINHKETYGQKLKLLKASKTTKSKDYFKDGETVTRKQSQQCIYMSLFQFYFIVLSIFVFYSFKMT